MNLSPELRKLLNALEASISAVYAESPSLIEMKGLEQAFVFRVGVNMENKLQECDLPSQVIMDCEYNKHSGEEKTIPWPNDKGEKPVRPDLVLHQRNNDDHNLMIVEFKGWWNTDGDDLKKLQTLTSKDAGYGYKLGVFVKLDRSEAQFRYFQTGEEVWQ